MPKQELIFKPEIVRLLTDLLYPEPKMAIREVLANAVDAIGMASAQGLMHGKFPPRIVFRPNRAQNLLAIEDNGIGLTMEESGALMDVGADEGKRKRFEKDLQSRGHSGDGLRAELEKLIGRYGIGRLACLSIASEVTIESVSRRGQDSGVRWHIRENDLTAELDTISQLEREQPGTTVTLRIKDKFRDELCDEIELEKVIREYGILLPYNIYVKNTGTTPVNVMQPVIYQEVADEIGPIPYRHVNKEDAAATTDPEARYCQLWDQIYGTREDINPPLVVFPLRTERVRGLLFVPSNPDFDEMGRVRLWCKRIFVKDDERGLLPEWARGFVSGVVDCISADPNLARTELLRSDEQEFQRLREEIELELVDHLGGLIVLGRQWSAFLGLYRNYVVHACNVNENLMRRVAKKITFRRAISAASHDKHAIDLERYEEMMGRRTGDADELPAGTEVDTEEHKRTLYYFTGEGSLTGIIERETVLHVLSRQESSLLQRWCNFKNWRHMDVGKKLPFPPIDGFGQFAEEVREAIGSDADRRRLEIEPVALIHRPDIPCILTNDRPVERRQEEHYQRLNQLSEDEFWELAQGLEGGPLRIGEMSRPNLTDMMVHAAIWGEAKSQGAEGEPLRDREKFYLNMANELMLHLAQDDLFDTEDEIDFRRKAIHELWHAAKIARGEPIVHPNTEHYFQTASDFLQRVIVDVYRLGRKARKDLELLRQKVDPEGHGG